MVLIDICAAAASTAVLGGGAATQPAIGVEEKAGLLLIDTMGPGCGGTVTPAGTRLIETQKMTRFILRYVV